MNFKVLSLTFLLICHSLYSQKEIDYQSLPLLVEHNRGSKAAEKWGIVKYNFEPLDWNAKPAKWYNFQESSSYKVPKEKLYPLKFLKGDKVEVIRVREGNFGGKYGKWVQVGEVHVKLPDNCTTEAGIIVPLESLDILPYQYCTLIKANKPFKIGDTLMIEPIKNYIDGKVFPYYAIKDNKRLNLASTYGISFELADVKEIKVTKSKREYFESPKAWVQIKDEKFNQYFENYKELKMKFIQTYFFPIIISITLLIVFLLLRKPNKTMSTSKENNFQKDEISGSSAFLGFALLLFTFFYWFNNDTKYTLPNIILNKSGLDDPMSIERFLIHFVSSILGTFFIITSGIPQLIGNRISIHPTISKEFYNNEQSARDKRRIIIISLCVLLGLIFTFLFFFPFLNGETPNSFILFLSLLLWLSIYVVKAVNYTSPVEFPSFSGPKDFSQQQIWIKLLKNQIAYIQSRDNEESYKLFTGDRPIDVSLCNVYIFETGNKLFEHIIDNEVVTKDTNGEIRYYFHFNLDREIEFPERLNSVQLKYINFKLMNVEEIKGEIFLANDKRDLLNDLKSTLTESVDKLSTETLQEIRAKNSINDVFSKINEKIFKGIQEQIKENIKNRITQNSGLSGVVLDFTFIPNNYFKNEIMDKINKKIETIGVNEDTLFNKLLEAYLKEKEMVLATILSASQNPAIGKSQIDRLLLVKSEIESTNPMNLAELRNVSARLKVQNENIIQIENESKPQIQISNQNSNLESIVNDLADELRYSISKGFKIEKIRKNIAESTTFFTENRIDIYKFFEALENKITDFENEKDKIYYRTIVREILNNLKY